MLASKKPNPPVDLKPNRIGEPLVGVRILVSPDAGTPYFYPGQNRVGTEMLARLLQARIELAGVDATRANGGFEFNRSFYMFTVSELGLALEAVKEELEKLGLLHMSQIAWRDPREEVWRPWHPKAGRFAAPSLEELTAGREFLDAIIGALKKCPRSEDEPPGQ